MNFSDYLKKTEVRFGWNHKEGLLEINAQTYTGQMI